MLCLFAYAPYIHLPALQLHRVHFIFPGPAPARSNSPGRPPFTSPLHLPTTLPEPYTFLKLGPKPHYSCARMHIYPAAGGNVHYSRDRYRYHAVQHIP